MYIISKKQLFFNIFIFFQVSFSHIEILFFYCIKTKFSLYNTTLHGDNYSFFFFF